MVNYFTDPIDLFISMVYKSFIDPRVYCKRFAVSFSQEASVFVGSSHPPRPNDSLQGQPQGAKKPFTATVPESRSLHPEQEMKDVKDKKDDAEAAMVGGSVGDGAVECRTGAEGAA
jgi:hypothetical protein